MTRCRVRRPRGFCGAGSGWRAVQQYTTSGLPCSGGKRTAVAGPGAINGVLEKIFAMVTLCLPIQSYRPAYSLQGLSNVDRSTLSPTQPTRRGCCLQPGAYRLQDNQRQTSRRVSNITGKHFAAERGVSAGRHLMFWPATPQRCKR